MWPFGKKDKSTKTTQQSPISTNPQNSISGNTVDLFSDQGALETFTGSKFAGGFGKTKIYVDGSIDYNLLRIRSKQLYIENLYAAGLINRLVINVINTGLKLQANPDNNILEQDEETLQKWTDKIESVFALWGDDPLLIDFRKQEDFELLQWTVYLTAKLSGDCLVVLRVTKPTQLPQVQVIDGKNIKTPFAISGTKNKIIKNGIEFDKKDRVVAYWVQTTKGFQRIPAFGEKSKRRIAWMVYGTKRLIDHTRGIPLLACALQALREIDRYTDSELRASFLNSVMTAWIKRDATPGTGAVFGRAATANAETEVQNPDGSTKESSLSWFSPGVMLDKLAPGEEPVSFDTKRPNLNFGDFIRMILSAVAWGSGLPPEIYFLEFKNNYSASRQASNEFNTFLRTERSQFSKQFNRPYYQEWLSLYALQGKVMMPGYLEALNNPSQWEMKKAWQKSKWIGFARPSVDPLKEINALEKGVLNNFMSTSDAIMELSGDDFDKVLARRKSEQQKINDSLENTDTENTNQSTTIDDEDDEEKDQNVVDLVGA